MHLMIATWYTSVVTFELMTAYILIKNAALEYSVIILHCYSVGEIFQPILFYMLVFYMISKSDIDICFRFCLLCLCLLYFLVFNMVCKCANYLAFINCSYSRNLYQTLNLFSSLSLFSSIRWIYPFSAIGSKLFVI